MLQVMRRMDIKIMGVSEMKCLNSGEMKVEDHKFYWETTDGVHKPCVGVISPNIAKCITTFVPTLERGMVLQVNASPIKINILQVYAPTADEPEDRVRELYHSIYNIIEKIRWHWLLIVMGGRQCRTRSWEQVSSHGRTWTGGNK